MSELPTGIVTSSSYEEHLTGDGCGARRSCIMYRRRRRCEHLALPVRDKGSPLLCTQHRYRPSALLLPKLPRSSRTHLRDCRVDGGLALGELGKQRRGRKARIHEIQLAERDAPPAPCCCSTFAFLGRRSIFSLVVQAAAAEDKRFHIYPHTLADGVGAVRVPALRLRVPCCRLGRAPGNERIVLLLTLCLELPLVGVDGPSGQVDKGKAEHRGPLARHLQAQSGVEAVGRHNHVLGTGTVYRGFLTGQLFPQNSNTGTGYL